jgi:hypothetical protein
MQVILWPVEKFVSYSRSLRKNHQAVNRVVGRVLRSRFFVWPEPATTKTRNRLTPSLSQDPLVIFHACYACNQQFHALLPRYAWDLPLTGEGQKRD